MLGGNKAEKLLGDAMDKEAMKRAAEADALEKEKPGISKSNDCMRLRSSKELYLFINIYVYLLLMDIAVDLELQKRITLDNEKEKVIKGGHHFGGTARGGKAAKMFGGK